MPRALTTDNREDQPNIEEERATSMDVASPSKGAGISHEGSPNGRQTSSLPPSPAVGEDRGNTSPILSGGGETAFEKRLQDPETAHSNAGEKDITANAAYATGELHNERLLLQDETPPQVIDTPGASGHPQKAEGRFSLASRGSFGMLRALPSFLRKGDSKATFRKGSDSRVLDNGDRETSSRWDSSTCRSFLSGEDKPWNNRVVNSKVFPVGHDHARARKNWRVMRAVIIALGKWREGVPITGYLKLV